LKEVKLYRDLKKQLGKRGNDLYKNLKTWKSTYKVEFFSAISEELAWEESQKVYKKVFNLDLDKSQIIFSKNEKLKWWIKVYLDDKVVDLSYQKIENMITK
jgi:hypothetical protein